MVEVKGRAEESKEERKGERIGQDTEAGVGFNCASPSAVFISPSAPALAAVTPSPRQGAPKPAAANPPPPKPAAANPPPPKPAAANPPPPKPAAANPPPPKPAAANPPPPKPAAANPPPPKPAAPVATTPAMRLSEGHLGRTPSLASALRPASCPMPRLPEACFVSDDEIDDIEASLPDEREGGGEEMEEREEGEERWERGERGERRQLCEEGDGLRRRLFWDGKEGCFPGICEALQGSQAAGGGAEAGIEHRGKGGAGFTAQSSSDFNHPASTPRNTPLFPDPVRQPPFNPPPLNPPHRNSTPLSDAMRQLLRRRLPHLQLVGWLEEHGDANGEPVFIDYKGQFGPSLADADRAGRPAWPAGEGERGGRCDPPEAEARWAADAFGQQQQACQPFGVGGVGDGVGMRGGNSGWQQGAGGRRRGNGGGGGGGGSAAARSGRNGGGAGSGAATGGAASGSGGHWVSEGGKKVRCT
ncbi:hypothetical protein CLOP_g12356 [Closterium sp. NIES-67]|nr:hypothetical protein CLOP_g12356 [Closterium sp. NIES-67]